MPSSIDLWTTIIVISLAHSFFMINLLLFKKQFRKPDGKWLLVLLLVFFWLQLEFLSIRWPYDMGVSIFYGTRHGTWLLVGPLFYFYLKGVIGTEVSKKDLYYLLPFGLFTICIPLLLNDFLTYRQVHYGMLTPFDSRPDQINFWQYLYSYVFVGQFLYLAFFLLKGRILISNYQQKLKNQSAELPFNNLRWLNILWLGMLLILLFVVVFLVLLFFTEIYRRHMDYLYVIPSSILVYAISYKLFNVTFERPVPVTKYQKSGLKGSEAETYIEQINKLVINEKLFLENGLKLKNLAEQIGISTHQLSEVLNQHMDTTFFDFINRYRVAEAKEKMKANQNHTLLHIAHASGFNNKTSFVNAFKRFEGKTPSQYIRSIQ